MELRTITKEELQNILKEHKLWLDDSTKGKRADLRNANFSWDNLRYANLCGADLRYANLCCADLRWANLRYADLSYANLCGANLRWANLRYADLSYANLRFSDLHSADLHNTGLLIFQYQQHQAHYTKDGTLTIGCLLMPITEWVLGYEEIGKYNKYSEKEIKAYGGFIKSCLEEFKGE